MSNSSQPYEKALRNESRSKVLRSCIARPSSCSSPVWQSEQWELATKCRSSRCVVRPGTRCMPVLVVGVVGLAINVVAAWLLKRTSAASLNVEGAFVHVLGDLLGSVGVIVAALLILAFGWRLADPIVGIIIGILLLVSAGRLLWKVLHVLMQGTPAHIDLDGLCQRLEGVVGVTGVHDIHAWTVTTGYDVFSAHVTADDVSGRTRGQTLLELRDIASSEFGISHVTIQLEDGQVECDEVHHSPHSRKI